MTNGAHYRELGKFVIQFQELENSLVEFFSVIAGKDYAMEILPAETEYPRLVKAIDAEYAVSVDRLREPDRGEVKARFHKLMEECRAIGALRNRLIRSTYALLVRGADVGALVQDEAKLKCNGSSRRQAMGRDQALESFEPYFQRIAGVVAELESFRLQITDWKPSGTELSARSTRPS
jgi:hypothetical protein